MSFVCHSGCNVMQQPSACVGMFVWAQLFFLVACACLICCVLVEGGKGGGVLARRHFSPSLYLLFCYLPLCSVTLCPITEARPIWHLPVCRRWGGGCQGWVAHMELQPTTPQTSHTDTHTHTYLHSTSSILSPAACPICPTMYSWRFLCIKPLYHSFVVVFSPCA